MKKTKFEFTKFFFLVFFLLHMDFFSEKKTNYANLVFFISEKIQIYRRKKTKFKFQKKKNPNLKKKKNQEKNWVNSNLVFFTWTDLLFSISLFWRDKISSNLIIVQWPRKCCKIFFSILDAAINGPHKITLSEAEFALGKIDSENALHFLTLKLLFIILCLNCCAKESAKQLSIR